MNILPRLLLRAGAIFLVAAVAAAPALTPAFAEGEIYYVNGSIGSDSNPGTEALPWKTIQKAADTLTAGQSVNVAAGTYPERVHITQSGASGALIAYQAVGTVVMRGFTVHASYIRISGFEMTAPKRWGVYLTGSYDIIEDNYIHDLAWGGIILFATISNPGLTNHVTLQNNTIAHVGQVGIDVRGRYNKILSNDISGIMEYVPWIANPPAWSDADGIHFHGRGHVFRGNKIHDILYSQPENPDPHIDCFQTFVASPSQEAANNILFDGNTCYEPTRSATSAAKLVQAQGAYGLRFTNNIVYTYLGGIIKNGGSVKLLNNTFVVPATATDGQGLQLKNAINVTVMNNIFSNQSDGNGAILADSTSKQSLVAGYNCLWKQGTWASNSGDIVGKDPRFVNPPIDFHLQAISPCINAGATVKNARDLDGHARPQGGAYDMGAYEQ